MSRPCSRRGAAEVITMREVSESMERVIAGPERKGRVMNEKTKHTIAYHESGHALVGHCSTMPIRCTRSRSSRAAGRWATPLSIPDEDKGLNSLSEMKDELAVFMGGRVAEEIFCDDITTGASTTLSARARWPAPSSPVRHEPFGHAGVRPAQPRGVLGPRLRQHQDYSEETARRIDEEVAKIMKEAHDRAHAILSSHADQMDLMASVLLERETVEGEAAWRCSTTSGTSTWRARTTSTPPKEAERAAPRKDASGAQGGATARAARRAQRVAQAPVDPDAGGLADPKWRDEPVEPGDQDPNAPFRTPAEHADRSDAQAGCAEIAAGRHGFLRRAPDPDKD